MKKYIILCLLILLVQSISAQRIVEGVVTDVGGHPVSAAIIKTVDATTKKHYISVRQILKENLLSQHKKVIFYPKEHQ